MNFKFCSVNPLDGTHYATYNFENWNQINYKLEFGQNAFENWRTYSFQDRQQLFLKIASLLLERQDQYAQIISEEMGKPINQAKAEIAKCALVCTYYANNAAIFLKDREIFSEKRTIISHAPLGIILQIMPWNFPFWQVFRFSAPTLMAGNVTLLKHAPNVPRSALAIEQLFKEAGFPEGVFQNTFAGLDDIPKIIGHKSVQGVALTGSNKAGTVVGALAGQNIKKVVLELGGSDPFIVLEDANIQEAVKQGVQSRFGNNGQTCIAAKRFIIHKKIAPAFITAFKIATQKLTFGSIMDPNAQLTTLARVDLAVELDRQIRESVALGAKVELEGGRKGDSAVFSPVILSHVKKGMPAYEEELFGPVATIFTVDSIEEAIELANDSIYGLGASIWTKNEAKALRMSKSINVGTVAINQLLRSAPTTPFGGVKQSGIGRELGAEGILEFINLKSIILD